MSFSIYKLLNYQYKDIMKKKNVATKLIGGNHLRIKAKLYYVSDSVSGGESVKIALLYQLIETWKTRDGYHTFFN